MSAVPSAMLQRPPAFEPKALASASLAQFAPRPRSLADTGLAEPFLADLVLKHLYYAGALDIQQLSARLALPGTILEPVIYALRNQHAVEVRPAGETGLIRYALTDRGRVQALEALNKSGYLGVAPVPLEYYRKVVQAQSVSRAKATKAQVAEAFSDVVASDRLIGSLGTAVNSTRPMFLYGPAGTGKTHLGRRLARLLGGHVLVPHALAVGETVIQYFDPVVHRPVPDGGAVASPLLEQGHDPRFVRCERPAVNTGGELTLDMLEIQYDPGSRQYRAPQQLMANNGMFMIDDLGRQRMSPDALLNRWIVPMEERADYLSIGSGQRFQVPFDVVLIFSTNLNPLELADEAFLRRLGYKIRFRYASAEEYGEIWRRFCRGAGLAFDERILNHVFERYRGDKRPMLPCHPRDLLNGVLDQFHYGGGAGAAGITTDQIDVAWDNYFVSLE